MTPFQTLYTSVMLFGPSIVLISQRGWVIGGLSFVASFVLSWALTLIFTPKLSIDALNFWAWTKPLLIACIVLWGGLNIF
ncbi:hypothetical protein ViNHUV68_41270 [Vibrio sp. NH-UV-68]